ncbi:acyl-CoA dehydrogenase [Micromonospora sp. NPDC050200]|uniref:acyl-CoA dehydrogenase n=1 Tax=Micromonospora sp. NPDC050200 TaxID=3155664 RepID=UPI003408EEFD
MRFALTAEQQDLREVVHELMERLCPPAVVRSAPDAPAIDALDRGLVELGAPGMLLSERSGGLGLDENYLVPLLTESGWAAAPLPVLETVGVASALFEAAGLAGRLLTGGMVCAADPTGAGLVRFAGRAALLVRGGWGGSGPVELVDLSDARREPVPAVDPAANLCRIGWGTVLGVVDDPVVIERAWQRGVLGAAAQLIGLSRRMLEMTVDHVGSRTQFGVPVGSFQAVKHQLASALLQVEFAAPAVARAGFSVAVGDPDRARDVSLAKALASAAAQLVARTAIQCHGAIGYTTEYDLHLYAKRAWALAADWGSAAWHRARIAEHLGLAPTGTLPVH